MLKVVCAFLILVLLAVGCSGRRDDFRSKLKSLSGKSKVEVEQMLGRPSEVKTVTDHTRTGGLSGAAEIWTYRAEEQGVLVRKGAIWFDERGRVMATWDFAVWK